MGSYVAVGVVAVVEPVAVEPVPGCFGIHMAVEAAAAAAAAVCIRQTRLQLVLAAAVVAAAVQRGWCLFAAVGNLSAEAGTAGTAGIAGTEAAESVAFGSLASRAAQSNQKSQPGSISASPAWAPFEAGWRPAEDWLPVESPRDLISLRDLDISGPGIRFAVGQSPGR